MKIGKTQFYSKLLINEYCKFLKNKVFPAPELPNNKIVLGNSALVNDSKIRSSSRRGSVKKGE
jgi:hypothetical protein